MRLTGDREDLDADLDRPVTVGPLLTGLAGGLAVAVAGMLALGRLTIGTLHGLGSAGTVANAILGSVLAAAVGVVASRFAATAGARRGAGRRGARRAGRAAGVGAVLVAVGLGMTVPLHPAAWVLALVLGAAAAWWTAGRQRPAGTGS